MLLSSFSFFAPSFLSHPSSPTFPWDRDDFPLLGRDGSAWQGRQTLALMTCPSFHFWFQSYKRTFSHSDDSRNLRPPMERGLAGYGKWARDGWGHSGKSVAPRRIRHSSSIVVIFSLAASVRGRPTAKRQMFCIGSPRVSRDHTILLSVICTRVTSKIDSLLFFKQSILDICKPLSLAICISTVLEEAN